MALQPRIFTRRSFLSTLAGTCVTAALAPRLLAASAGSEVSVRPLTRGPKFHWFGYYDKLQFDPSGRYILGNEAGFEGRSPRAGDEIRAGMVDTAEGDRWIDLSSTRAWNWQQGCMLQWLPGPGGEVLWNDREDGRFVCHVLNPSSGKKRTLPHPVYALSPDGKQAISTDFPRLNDCRPGYGYAGPPDAHGATPAPETSGIWKMDLQSGDRTLLLSYAQVAAQEPPGGYSKGAKHWFNHLLVAPGGRRFTFLHRWRGEAEGRGWKTRMFTAGMDGRDLHLLIDNGRVSHFVWRDADHVLAYAGLKDDPKVWRFQVFKDRAPESRVVNGMLEVDGHCTYLPSNEWILCDTYPDKERHQLLYLLRLADAERREIGRFFSPNSYKGEWRCDLHPRSSPDGSKVCIDSTHENGRQMYLLDIRAAAA